MQTQFKTKEELFLHVETNNLAVVIAESTKQRTHETQAVFLFDGHTQKKFTEKFFVHITQFQNLPENQYFLPENDRKAEKITVLYYSAKYGYIHPSTVINPYPTTIHFLSSKDIETKENILIFGSTIYHKLNPNALRFTFQFYLNLL